MRIKYTFDFRFNTQTTIGLLLVILANFMVLLTACVSTKTSFGGVVAVFIFTFFPFLFGYFGGRKIGVEIKEEKKSPDRVNYSHTGRGY